MSGKEQLSKMLVCFYDLIFSEIPISERLSVSSSRAGGAWLVLFADTVQYHFQSQVVCR